VSASVHDITYFITVTVYCIVRLLFYLYNIVAIVFVVLIIVLALYSLCVVCPLLFV
jgi:hypothetical protein